MIIFPAIDIKDGKCVRLIQGKADSSTVYYENPLDAAKLWADKGSKWLHIVDLDGAFEGRPRNLDTILKIKKQTSILIELGGGMRDESSIKDAANCAIDRIILGTAALKNPSLIKWSVDNFKDTIAVSIDALNNMVAYNGWTGVSNTNVTNLIEELINLGIKTFIYTDISKDGMLKGPNTLEIKGIADMFDINLIASGGITNLNDIIELKAMNIYGAIIGKALYNGDIEFEEALEVAECSQRE